MENGFSPPGRLELPTTRLKVVRSADWAKGAELVITQTLKAEKNQPETKTVQIWQKHSYPVAGHFTESAFVLFTQLLSTLSKFDYTLSVRFSTTA